MTLDAIVLDLDDTLYDTSGKLLPAADLRAVETLCASGLRLTADAALAEVRALRERSVTDAFRALAAAHGLPDAAGAAADDAFFRYTVPEMALDDDVAAALDELHTLAPLALLTMGDPSTQRAKSARLGLTRWFCVEEFVAGGAAGGKSDALARLVAGRDWAPSRTVFAGDRPDSDVRAANRVGCRAVLVRRPGAEFSSTRIDTPGDTPWRTISHVRELAALLRR
ncbi:MAG: HAD family hydrolase [Planctomycetes bacterium]|nr:HAD family hydrolase [Planctomycetota bacterium]